MQAHDFCAGGLLDERFHQDQGACGCNEMRADLFQQIVKKGRLGRRKAYYLVEVSRKFEPLPISRARLKKIGWTKLQIIGQHVTKDNVEELVSLAEQLKTKQLERKMQGDEPLDNAHCVLMYFSPKQYAAFEGALLKNGGERSGRGPPGCRSGPGSSW